MVKKILLYSLLTLLLLLASGVTFVWLYQDKIIGLFVQEINKHLKTEVRVGKISLSLFEKFPQVAIRFDQLRIKGTVPEDARPMATARKLYGTFDLRDLIMGRYVVHQVYLEEADVLLFVDEQGRENFDVFRRTESTASQSKEEAGFDLEEIILKNVKVRYERGRQSGDAYELLAQDATARLSTRGSDLDIALRGNLVSQQIRVGEQVYFKNKQLVLNSELHYQLADRRLTIRPSTVTIHQAHFQVQGSWQQAKTEARPEVRHDLIDLTIQSKQTDIQTIVSLLPEETARRLGSYQSRGDVFFNGTVKGKIGKGALPGVDIRFGCRNATFIYPKSGKKLEKVFLSGSYSNGRLQNATTSSLNLKNIGFELNGRKFSGELSWLNFRNPTLIFQVQGNAEVGSLLAFYPVDKIERAQGEVALRVSFNGKISDLKAERLLQYVRTSGEITVKDLRFRLRGVDLPFEDFNGNFQFQKSDLRVSQFSGRAGSSDFLVNGYFKNIMAYLLLRDQDLGVEANFQSDLLNCDELLTAGSSPGQATSTSAGEPYRFRLSHRLSLDLNCRVNQLRFRRFHARRIQGRLDMNNQVAALKDLSLHTAGGSIFLDANVNGHQNNRIIVETHTDLERIAVDSAFYMLENFKQTFIQDRHLKGRLSANVHAFLVFDEQLNLISPLAKAEIETSVVDGELNNFAPMQKLSFFLRRRELANIRFSELRNNIRIANRTVTIPEMEIRSNVATISIFGTHTFDQVMDYHLRFPLSNLARPDKDEKFGTVASDGRGSGNLLLAIRGTSDNFKISYDMKQVGKKIMQDLKQQKQRWQNPFKKETQTPEPEPEEAEDKYFDFN